VGFVSFNYWYDGNYMLEMGVEVRWTGGKPLEKACLVELEWDEEEARLDNYFPNQEEKTSVVSHSSSRSVSVKGGIQATAGGPTGGLEMGVDMTRAHATSTSEANYHTQLHSLTPSSLSWVLEHNEMCETKKFATHLRKVFKAVLKVERKIEHGGWGPGVKVVIGYDKEKQLPQMFRARLFHNIFIVCPLKIHSWTDKVRKLSLDEEGVLKIVVEEGVDGRELVLTEIVEVEVVVEWALWYNEKHPEEKIPMSEQTENNIKNLIFSEEDEDGPPSPRMIESAPPHPHPPLRSSQSPPPHHHHHHHTSAYHSRSLPTLTSVPNHPSTAIFPPFPFYPFSHPHPHSHPFNHPPDPFSPPPQPISRSPASSPPSSSPPPHLQKKE